jgi:hypothetical protein
MSTEIWSEVSDVLKQDIVDRPSFFQFKHFVVGKEATIQGKMWQCLRELRSRKSWVENHLSEIAETKDRIELLNIEREKNALLLAELMKTERQINLRQLAQKETEVKGRQIDRKISSLNEQIYALETKIKDYESEAAFFLSEFRQLEEVEPLRELDDIDAQKEYWTTKLFQEINLKMLLQQPIDLEVIKTVLCLNDDSPLKQQVLRMLASNRQAIEKVVKNSEDK